MSIILIKHPPTSLELTQLTSVFSDYIKLVADIKKNILYGGCQLHVDAEQILLKHGSKQENIWGGGVNLKLKKIEITAIANIRAGLNPAPEILDPNIRQKFITIVKQFFPQYKYG